MLTDQELHEQILHIEPQVQKYMYEVHDMAEAYRLREARAHCLAQAYCLGHLDARLAAADLAIKAADVHKRVDRTCPYVIEALIARHIYSAEHETDPRKAINDLIAWDVRVALDPAVSSDAADLISRHIAAGRVC